MCGVVRVARRRVARRGDARPCSGAARGVQTQSQRAREESMLHAAGECMVDSTWMSVVKRGVGVAKAPRACGTCAPVLTGFVSMIMFVTCDKRCAKVRFAVLRPDCVRRESESAPCIQARTYATFDQISKSCFLIKVQTI